MTTTADKAAVSKAAAGKGAASKDVVASDLVNVTIDGTVVAVPKGTLIIRAAEQVGIDIPRFCDHPALAPAGACRQCLVDVASPGPDGNLSTEDDIGF